MLLSFCTQRFVLSLLDAVATTAARNRPMSVSDINDIENENWSKKIVITVITFLLLSVPCIVDDADNRLLLTRKQRLKMNLFRTRSYPGLTILLFLPVLVLEVAVC